MNASRPLITTQRPLQISSLNETMQVLNSTLAAVANFTLMPVISSGSDNASSSLAPLTPSPSTASDKCKAFAYNFHENIPISAVCGLCFIIGLILVLVGTYHVFIPFSNIDVDFDARDILVFEAHVKFSKKV